MDFYKTLSKLLKIADELEESKNISNASIPEIQRKIQPFLENLKYILKYQIKNEERNNFRRYFITYLNRIIMTFLNLSSNNEKNEIYYLLKKIYNNKDIQNIFNQQENLINFNLENNKNRNERNYNNYQNNCTYNTNSSKEVSKYDIILNTNESELCQSKYYYAKQYMNNINLLQNRNTINNNMIKNNHPQNIASNQNNINNVDNNNAEIYSERNEYIQFNLNKEKVCLNEKMKVPESPEIIQRYQNNFNNNKYRRDNWRNIKLTNGYINNYNNYTGKYNLYYNNQNFYNNKAKIRQKTMKKYRNEKDIKSIGITVKNDFIEKKNSNKKNSIIIENEKTDNNLNSLKNEKKEKQNNNNRKINANTQNKYEKEIDKLYQELFKGSISQYFINSIINKNNINNFNRICPSVFDLVENSKQEYIDQIYKEKITTLVCLLFYFAKGQRTKINDCIFKSDLEIDKKLFKYLKQTILIPNNSKVIDFSANKINYFSKNFCKNLLLENTNEDKHIIFSIYTFLIITRCLRKSSKENEKKFFDELLEKEYIISFKLHFILKHQEFYKAISDDFINIYHGLNFINVFYTEIFLENNENNRIMKDEQINKYIFGKNKFILSFDKNSSFEIKALFSKIDNEIYEEVMEKINHFFYINEYDYNDVNDLIYYSTNNLINKDSNFILNLVEHVCEKNRYIYNNFNKYKDNLINLEYEIFNYGKNILSKKKNSKIEKYSINEAQKNVFDSLLNKINEKINPKYKNKFELFPYGSITQFLGGNSSDIDIYLHIKNDKIKEDREKINLIYALEKTIENIIKYSPKVVISKRLCLISFKYVTHKDSKKTDFDISLMGFCPYIHSTLLRAYSLMDPRFSLLAITLKRFLAIIKLKNYENKQDFLNSFSWMILLITFLQDIIKPQILPKILSDENNYISNIPIPYAKYNEKNIVKTYEFFIKNVKEENTLVPFCLNDNNLLKKIYQKKIQNKEKNNLSCAEIFLYFLEFIIYYFKCDSVYANCSVENEAYESMYYIMNNNNLTKNKIDERFRGYFKGKYCKAKNLKNNKITKDGFILIRDPFDPYYNPAHTLRNGNYKIFLETLKNGYSSLLQNGNEIFHPVNYFKNQ